MASLMLFPALDLLGGRCVRPHRGDAPSAQAFDADPVEVATAWKEQGAAGLHVVDLDGALAGEPKHLAVVRQLVEATGMFVQVGGGLWTEAHVAAAFEAGAQRVVLAPEAARNPEMLAGCLARWNDQIAVSVDTRGGSLTVAGWLEILSESVLIFAQRMAQVGVKALIMTNVERDGTLAGAEKAGMSELRAALPNTTLLAAGGVSSLDDLRWLAQTGLDGAILGRPLYDGTLDLAEALRVAAEASPAAAPVAAPAPDPTSIPDSSENPSDPPGE
jgi:phosphoribosylformimino-5-aminoimidazole carboxamide ribotide isomerase